MNIKVVIADGTVIRPGDSLVVAINNTRLTAEQAQLIRSTLLDEIPDLAGVVVIYGADVIVQRHGESI